MLFHRVFIANTQLLDLLVAYSFGGDSSQLLLVRMPDSSTQSALEFANSFQETKSEE